jgi:hypothetical protein
MQNSDRDQIKKTISEYREAIFAAMLNKHYTHAALYMKCMIACVPSEIKLEVAIEAPEANLMSNENATDYAKRLFKWIDIVEVEMILAPNHFFSLPFRLIKDFITFTYLSLGL